MKRMIYLIVFLFLISFVNAYEIEYVHQDHLGNNIAITNEEGDVIWKADYEPFGSSFNEVGDNNKKYNNKEEDSTKLLYYGARYYDKDIGRFTTPDPLSGSITDPQTLNRYVYVTNNPMKYIDPTGMAPRIKDEGFAFLYMLSSIEGDTLIQGHDIGNLNTELPFDDLKNVEQVGNLVFLKINSKRDKYKTSIPKYKIDGVYESVTNNIGKVLGKVIASSNVGFEKELRESSVTFHVVSGSLEVDLVWVLNVFGLDDMGINSISMVTSKTGKIYAVSTSFKFYKNNKRKYSASSSLFDLETNTIYGITEALMGDGRIEDEDERLEELNNVREGLYSKGIPSDVISESSEIFESSLYREMFNFRLKNP